MSRRPVSQTSKTMQIPIRMVPPVRCSDCLQDPKASMVGASSDRSVLRWSISDGVCAIELVCMLYRVQIEVLLFLKDRRCFPELQCIRAWLRNQSLVVWDEGKNRRKTGQLRSRGLNVVARRGLAREQIKFAEYRLPAPKDAPIIKTVRVVLAIRRWASLELVYGTGRRASSAARLLTVNWPFPPPQPFSAWFWNVLAYEVSKAGLKGIQSVLFSRWPKSSLEYCVVDCVVCRWLRYDLDLVSIPSIGVARIENWLPFDLRG